jgi:hypothetical protein
MSALGQTGGGGLPRLRVSAAGTRTVGELLLYGLDDTGQTAFTERLADLDRDAVRGRAEERLRDWRAVEVWDGPVCVVRLRRQAARTA